MGDAFVGPPAAGIIETEINGDIALYDPSREMVAVLNATASDIWRLLDGTQTIEAIVDTLATAYGADRSIVAVDVEHAIHTLRSDGYLPA